MYTTHELLNACMVTITSTYPHTIYAYIHVLHTVHSHTYNQYNHVCDMFRNLAIMVAPDGSELTSEKCFQVMGEAKVACDALDDAKAVIKHLLTKKC